jgi:hypothetical protein
MRGCNATPHLFLPPSTSTGIYLMFKAFPADTVSVKETKRSLAMIILR